MAHIGEQSLYKSVNGSESETNWCYTKKGRGTIQHIHVDPLDSAVRLMEKEDTK